MPYMCHTETCRRSGYTFWPSNPRQDVFFSSLTLKQSAKLVPSLRARVPIHSPVWHPPIGFNLFVFCRKLILVLMFSTYLKFSYDIQYKNLLEFPLKTTHFCVLIHCPADCCLLPQAICPGNLPLPQKN